MGGGPYHAPPAAYLAWHSVKWLEFAHIGPDGVLWLPGKPARAFSRLFFGYFPFWLREVLSLVFAGCTGPVCCRWTGSFGCGHDIIAIFLIAQNQN